MVHTLGYTGHDTGSKDRKLGSVYGFLTLVELRIDIVVCSWSIEHRTSSISCPEVQLWHRRTEMMQGIRDGVLARSTRQGGNQTIAPRLELQLP
jgi:hypothetical protein